MDQSYTNRRFSSDPHQQQHQQQQRNSVYSYSTDVNDFYDGAAIPAPHRLTGNYNNSPLATPTASFTDLPRAYSVGSLSHLNNSQNGHTASRRQSGLGVYEERSSSSPSSSSSSSSSDDITPENEKSEFGLAAAAGAAFPERKEEAQEGQFDPQGRGAQRLALRREREKGPAFASAGAGAGMAGYIPVSLGDTDPVNTPRNTAGTPNNNNTNNTNAVPTSPYSKPNNNNNPTRRRKWILLFSVLALLVLVGLGVGLGVGLTVGRNRHTAGSSSNLASSSSGSGSGLGTNTTDANTTAGTGNTTTTMTDASVFTKDSRLHDSFYGFAYTPQNVLLPTCGASLSNITHDIQLLSQLTNKLRLYGSNCNQTSLVLQAIKDTNVQMGVYVAVYVDADEQAYEDQVEAIRRALVTYGTGNVLGITVGNEYILNQQLAGLSTTTATQTILSHIKQLNTTVKGWGLDKALPIGTSDAGSLMSASLAAGIDYFHANVHPWFGTVGINDAAQWTFDFFQEFDVDVANSVAQPPRCAIAETGWPTNSMTTTEGNNGVVGSQGDASIANLQIFLDTFVCQANANNTDYFFFEAFDEPWKAQYGGVEPYWGLFDSDRNLKSGLTIPDCSHT